MRKLLTPLDRLHPLLKTGLVLCGLACSIWLFGATIYARSLPAQVTPAADTTVYLPVIMSAASRNAAALAAVPRLAAASEQQYLAVALASVGSDATQSAGWIVEARQTPEGPIVLLNIPVNAGTSLTAVQQQVATVVNALFSADPALQRAGVVVSTVNAQGQMQIGLSLFVSHGASPAWGTVTFTELEPIAQSIVIHEELFGMQ